jgi:hypothetical protein
MTHAQDLPEITPRLLRQFGFILGGGIAFLFGLLFPWLGERAIPLWPWIFLAIVAGTGLILPMALKPVYLGWMKLGAILGWINTRIILGLVFYVIFVPVSFLLKLSGKDPMARKLDRSLSSYRVKSKPATPNQLERPF